MKRAGRLEALGDLKACELCPRRCGVDRLSGELGFCRAGRTLQVFRSGPHHGEEPPISGTRGSGTLFLSRCTLQCLYCQNHPWSQSGAGTPMTVTDLAAQLIVLAESGCHNWNFVSPTPWLPLLRQAVSDVKRDGTSLPCVYNTSGFERTKVLDDYHELIDIALVDLRYASDTTAHAASACRDYVDAARGCVQWCHQHLGPLTMDADGIAQRGTICRMLVLPGHADEAVANLHWLADTLGTEVAISVMSQYTPVYAAVDRDEWARGITPEEYARVTKTVERLGFETGWVQEPPSPPPDGLLGCRMPAGHATTDRR